MLCLPPTDLTRDPAMGTPLTGIVPAAVVVAGMKAAQGVLMLACLVLAAQWLGAPAYGVFATLLAAAGLLAVPLALGLPQALLRWVAARAPTERRAVFAGSLRGLALATGAALLGGAAVSALTGGPLPLVAVAAGALLAGVRVLGAWLQAHGRVRAAPVGEALVRPGALLVLLALAGALGLAPRGDLAGGLLLAALMAALGVAVWQVARLAPPGPAAPAAEPPPWRTSALPLLGVGLAHAVMANADVLMLGALAGTETAGIYHVASRVALTAGLVIAAVNAVAAPRLARLAAAGDEAGLARLASAVAWLLAVPLALALPVLAVGGATGLGWLGAGFAAGAPALLILWAGQLVNVACGPVAVLLTVAGGEAAALRGVVLGALANVGLNAGLIPTFGLTGAAVATAASTVLWNLVLWRAVRRRLGVDASLLGRPVRKVA